ncbi:unnamed protein product, partial [Rotaria magnacalcarata]
MFKPLIKKVREKSNNPSILPENSSDEANDNIPKDHKNSSNQENSSSSRAHRRSDSIVQQTLTNKSRPSSISKESDNNEAAVKSLSNVFSAVIQEPISIDNYVQVLKSWMDAKEEILQQKDDSIQSLLKETVNLQNELTLMKSQFADF